SSNVMSVRCWAVRPPCPDGLLTSALLTLLPSVLVGRLLVGGRLATARSLSPGASVASGRLVPGRLMTPRLARGCLGAGGRPARRAACQPNGSASSSTTTASGMSSLVSGCGLGRFGRPSGHSTVGTESSGSNRLHHDSLRRLPRRARPHR